MLGWIARIQQLVSVSWAKVVVSPSHLLRSVAACRADDYQLTEIDGAMYRTHVRDYLAPPNAIAGHETGELVVLRDGFGLKLPAGLHIHGRFNANRDRDSPTAVVPHMDIGLSGSEVPEDRNQSEDAQNHYAQRLEAA
jgi:hypothetical protein